MTMITTTPPLDRTGFSHQFPERYFYLMVFLLMSTGLRQREVLDLKTESTDLDQRILTVTSRKTRTTQQVSISPDLHGILVTYVKEHTRARQTAMTRLERVRRLRHRS